MMIITLAKFPIGYHYVNDHNHYLHIKIVITEYWEMDLLKW